MESFKKIISLREASKISGYTQDYIGFLIRRGEIKAVKKGKFWFTTEEEIKNYIFKRKVLNRKFALFDFFSIGRTKKIIIVTVIIIFCGFLLFSYFNKNKSESEKEINSAINSDNEFLYIQ